MKTMLKWSLIVLLAGVGTQMVAKDKCDDVLKDDMCEKRKCTDDTCDKYACDDDMCEKHMYDLDECDDMCTRRKCDDNKMSCPMKKAKKCDKDMAGAKRSRRASRAERQERMARAERQEREQEQKAERAVRPSDKDMERAPRPTNAGSPAAPALICNTGDLAAIRECLCALRSLIGNPDDEGICLETKVDAASINALNLSLISHFKTLYQEIRGCPF